MRRWLTSIACAALISAPHAFGQAIEVAPLGSAAAFDVGTLDSANGGLDTQLWQSTSAKRAIYLLEAVPTRSDNPHVISLIRAAVLTGGVPPVAGGLDGDERYKQARIQTVLALGDMTAAQSIIRRTPELSADLALSANIALMAGNTDAACLTADRVVDGRGMPQWARLRAFCHILRGENPAAEVTTDILRNSGYEDPAFFSLMRILSGSAGKPDISELDPQDGLHMAMLAKAALAWPGRPRPQSLAARIALSDVASPEDRLSALYDAGSALSDAQFIQVLDGLAAPTPEPAEIAASPDSVSAEAISAPEPVTLETALAAPLPKGMGQLFLITQSGPQSDRPKAAQALLQRADKASVFKRMSLLLSPALRSFSPEEQIITDLPVFTRAAIVRGDIAALQSFFRRLEDNPEAQARIALIADALGYGFIGGPLGIDIETRLGRDGEGQTRAVRDAFIAAAMGASLSDDSLSIITQASAGDGRTAAPGLLAALELAARDGARAETALWAALILEGEKLDNSSLYRIIKALNAAGLSRFSGRIAADDFFRDFPDSE